MRVLEVDVHELEPTRAHMIDRGPDVVGLQRDVVQALAPRIEELGEEAVGDRLEQLDDAPAGKAHLVPPPRPPGIPAFYGSVGEMAGAQSISEESERGIDRMDG